jgi:hypothetical protein
MTDTWAPITRASVEVTGVDTEHAGLLHVVVQLSAVPPQEWPHRFENPVTVDAASMHPPRVNGTRVTLHVQDERVREYLENVDARIDEANRYYSDEVLPAKAAKAQALADERAEVARRITEAQAIADSMTPAPAAGAPASTAGTATS